MKILVTTGMPGSGKEELLKCCEVRGAKVMRMGDIVREKAKEFGLNLSDASVGGLADEERKRYGMDIWAKRTIPFVGGDLVVIDGTRGPDEIAAFKKAFGDALKVVAIQEQLAYRLTQPGAAGVAAGDHLTPQLPEPRAEEPDLGRFTGAVTAVDGEKHAVLPGVRVCKCPLRKVRRPLIVRHSGRRAKGAGRPVTSAFGGAGG